MVHLNKGEQIALLQHLGSLYSKKPNPMLLALRIMKDETLYTEHELYVQLNRILQKMKEPYAQIIRNDYLMSKKPYWWKDMYTKKKYDQVKNMALVEFFRLLYPEFDS